MLAIRVSKIVVAAGLALYALIVGISNVVDYDRNLEFVRVVLTMDRVVDPDLTWRAISNPIVHRVAYALIILAELATGIAFAVGAGAMWRSRRESKAGFHRAKSLIAIALIIGFITWFIAFMTIGGEWFVMARAGEWNGQPVAFRFYITVLVAGVYILLDNDGDLPVRV